MDQRINDLCEACRQFLLGVLPMAGSIQDDLQSMIETGETTLSYADCKRVWAVLKEIREMDTELGIKLTEIHFLLNKIMPLDPTEAEPKAKKQPTLTDALDAVKGFSQEDINKLLKELK